MRIEFFRAWKSFAPGDVCEMDAPVAELLVGRGIAGIVAADAAKTCRRRRRILPIVGETPVISATSQQESKPR